MNYRNKECGNKFPTLEIMEIASNKWLCKSGNYYWYLCPVAYFSIRQVWSCSLNTGQIKQTQILLQTYLIEAFLFIIFWESPFTLQISLEFMYVLKTWFIYSQGFRSGEEHLHLFFKCLEQWKTSWDLKQVSGHFESETIKLISNNYNLIHKD